MRRVHVRLATRQMERWGVRVLDAAAGRVRDAGCAQRDGQGAQRRLPVFSDLGHRREHDLPREVEHAPQLRVEHAQRAHVLPQPVDELHVRHEPAHRALRPAPLKRRPSQRVREPQQALRAELRDIYELAGGGRRARAGRGHVREGCCERGEQRGEERVRAHRVQVCVQERERFGARDRERDDGERERGAAPACGQPLWERGQEGAVRGEHERGRGVERDGGGGRERALVREGRDGGRRGGRARGENREDVSREGREIRGLAARADRRVERRGQVCAGQRARDGQER